MMVLMFLLRTSSNSVEQARERSYHRALLLSKDKETGEKSETDSVVCIERSLYFLK